jgi:hypothetical protein
VPRLNRSAARLPKPRPCQPNKPAVATIPEAATDVAGVPRGSQTSGQAPNVSRRMGAEM